MRTTTTLILVGLVTGCSDDGTAGGDTDPGTTSAITAATADAPGESGGDPSDGAPQTSGPDATGDADPTVASSASGSDTDGGDTAGDDASTGGESDPGTTCPPGPYADAPLSAMSVTATALRGSSTSVGAGGLLEGPVWWNGALYLSHFWFQGQPPPANILRYDGGALEVVFEGSGSNGLAIGPDGQLIGGDHLNGTISAFDPDAGTRSTVVESFEGQRFNSPNDLTVRSDGTLYFTDPTYQAPQPAPQAATGVYRVDPSGVVEQFETSLSQPNGVTISPDETALYVGHAGGLVRYDLNADGTVVTPGEPFGNVFGGVDGMAVDCAGNLYVTLHAEGRIVVRSPAGDDLGEIQVAPQVTNAAFGGPDQQTLFITAGNPDAGDALYSIDLQIPGLPF